MNKTFSCSNIAFLKNEKAYSDADFIICCLLDAIASVQYDESF